MRNWVVDLDGVMWRGAVPVPGAADAVATLLGRGDRVLFCTNNSAESGTERAARLQEQGIPAGCEVVTSADAVCDLVLPGESALVVGGPGLLSALSEHGAHPTTAAGLDPTPIVGIARAVGAGEQRAAPFDVVVVGFTREFDYDQVDAAAASVRAGARLVASNSDTTFPGADGLHPGCGALLAAVEAAAGCTAEVAGKPLAPMARLVAQRLGLDSEEARRATVVVGDRPDTDGALAARMGVSFALVLSGVTSADQLPCDVPTAFVADDLPGLVALGTDDDQPPRGT